MQKPKRLVQSLPEGSIITSIRQRNRRDLYPLTCEIILKDFLGHLRAFGRYGSIRTTVCVGDAEVAFGNHVEVDVHEEIVNIRDGQVRRVELAAKKTFLFSAPPSEANLTFRFIV